jgi:CRISPR-associated exonuclease Cas4
MEHVSVKRIDQIFSDMSRKYIKSREELRKRFQREGKILLFVHELCECSHKRKMRQRFSQIERAETYNPRFAVGQLIEEALKLRFQNEREHIYTKELGVDGKNGKSYVISGMIDIIDQETKTPIEVKYLTTLGSKPYEHHVLQLRLYLWLVKVRKGELLYISPEGLKSYPIRKPLTDGEVIRLIREEKAPRWNEWECYYCPYQQFCNKSNCQPKRRKASR